MRRRGSLRVSARVRLISAAAELLAPEGVSVTVVDPRWVLPVSDTVVKLAENYRLVVGPILLGGCCARWGCALPTPKGRTEEQRDAIRRYTIENYGSIHRYILGAVPADA